MAPSRKCPYCYVYWPAEAEYELCPQCREPTEDSFMEALPLEQVELIRVRAEFGWWLYEHDRL